MAIVTYGPLVDEVRGSVGGVTFSRAGSGCTVRAKPRPPKPVSEAQVLMQSHLAEGAATWKPIAQVTKDLWDAYAATITLYDSLGRAYHPTGRQAFIWSLCIQKLGDEALDMTAPSDVGLAVLPTLTFDFNVHDLRLTVWVPAPNEFDRFFFVTYWADRPRTFNRRRRKNLVTCFGDEGLPFELCPDIDQYYPLGSELRAFVGIRGIDADHRVSTLRMQSLDFTVV